MGATIKNVMPIPETASELLGLPGLAAAHALYEKLNEAQLNYDKARAEKASAPVNELPELDVNNLYALSSNLPTLVDYYLKQMASDNSALFRYLSDEQKKTLEDRLKFTYFLLYAQHQLDVAFSRRKNLKSYYSAMEDCERLLDKLYLEPTEGEPETPKTRLLKETAASTYKPAKYLGLVVGQWLAEKILEFISATTLVDWMTEFNVKRLYWVWGGGMLGSVLAMIPDDFFNKTTADTALNSIAPITGYISWVLYYARFGLNVALLLKHTCINPTMEEAEQEVELYGRRLTTLDRFKTQWDQRKFTLLNDSVWGTANLICFFWLFGSGWTGYSGNLVSAGLLIFDVIIAVWRFNEAQTLHNKQIVEIDGSLKNLNSLVEQAKADNNSVQITALTQQILDQKALKDQTITNWQHKKYGLVIDMVYATGLVTAFIVACCFFFPPSMLAPATVLIIGLAGAALCFVLNAAYAAITNGMEIHKTRLSLASLKEKHTLHQKTFNDNLLDLEDLNRLGQSAPDLERELKINYLALKDLEAEMHYHNAMIRYQSIKLVRSILIDAMVPFLVFTGFVFMPMGVGIAVLAAGFALAVSSNILINQFFKPEMAEKTSFVDNKSSFFSPEPASAESKLPALKLYSDDELSKLSPNTGAE